MISNEMCEVCDEKTAESKCVQCDRFICFKHTQHLKGEDYCPRCYTLKAGGRKDPTGQHRRSS